MKVVVLASGRGSNFEALLKNKRANRLIGIEFIGLITDNASARAIDIARKYDVPVFIVHSAKRKGYLSKEEESNFIRIITDLAPDLIVFAGFMRIVSNHFIESVNVPIINIHPSLLPMFKGLNAQKQALDAGVSFTGCSVHFVNEQVDSGNIIIQRIVSIEKDDTEDTLASRILRYEHEILTEAIELIYKMRGEE